MDDQRGDGPEEGGRPPARPGQAADGDRPEPGHGSGDAAGEAAPGDPARPAVESWWTQANTAAGGPGTLRPLQWDPNPEAEQGPPARGAMRPDAWQPVPARPTLVQPLPEEPERPAGQQPPEAGPFERPRAVEPDPPPAATGPSPAGEPAGGGPPPARPPLAYQPSVSYERPTGQPSDAAAGYQPTEAYPIPGYRPTEPYAAPGYQPTESHDAGYQPTEFHDAGYQPTERFERGQEPQPTEALPPGFGAPPVGHRPGPPELPGWGPEPDTVQQEGEAYSHLPGTLPYADRNVSPARTGLGQGRWVILGFAVVLPVLAALAVIALFRGMSSGGGATAGSGTSRTSSGAATQRATSPPAGSHATGGPSVAVTGLRTVQAGSLPGLLPGTRLEGHVDGAWSWTDANGTNVFVTSHTDQHRGGKPRAVTFLVTHLAQVGTGKPVELRRMRDPVDVRCPGSGPATGGFTPDSVAVQDLDRNGVAEVSVGWTARCGGADRPTRVRLAMLAGGRKYIVRGVLVLGTGDPSGALKPDPAIGSWPPGDHDALVDLARRLYG